MRKTEFINTVAQVLTEWYPKGGRRTTSDNQQPSFDEGFTITAEDLLKNEAPKQVRPVPQETKPTTNILPKGGYRITMRDLATNVAPKAVEEQGAFNDAGEPLMTHQQYRDYSEPAERDPDNTSRHGHSWNDDPILSHFNQVDWKEVYEMMKENTLEPGKHHINDFTEENPEERPMVPSNDLHFLADANVIYIDDGYPMFDVPTNDAVPDLNTFMASVQKAKSQIDSGTYKHSQHTTGNDSEAPYMRGYEPMSEAEKKEIYSQFKNIITESMGFPTSKISQIYDQYQNLIKEDVGKIDFNTRIRGVVYEYAQEAPSATPTTTNPTRNPEEPADNIISKGQDMKKIGDATEKLGQTKKDAERKAKSAAIGTPVAVLEETKEKPKCKKCHDTGNYFVKNDYADPTSRNTKTHKGKTGKWVRCPYCDPKKQLKEYVETEIMPAVIEIMKRAEHPRAKKKDLMEMFKLQK